MKNKMIKVLQEADREAKIDEFIHSAPCITTNDIEEILKHKPLIFRNNTLNKDDKELLIVLLEARFESK